MRVGPEAATRRSPLVRRWLPAAAGIVLALGILVVTGVVSLSGVLSVALFLGMILMHLGHDHGQRAPSEDGRHGRRH